PPAQLKRDWQSGRRFEFAVRGRVWRAVAERNYVKRAFVGRKQDWRIVPGRISGAKHRQRVIAREQRCFTEICSASLTIRDIDWRRLSDEQRQPVQRIRHPAINYLSRSQRSRRFDWLAGEFTDGMRGVEFTIVNFLKAILFGRLPAGTNGRRILICKILRETVGARSLIGQQAERRQTSHRAILIEAREPRRIGGECDVYPAEDRRDDQQSGNQ